MLESLLKHKITLYILLFLVITNLFNYISNNKYNSILIFSLTAFLFNNMEYQQTHTLIIALTVSTLYNMFLYSKEGLPTAEQQAADQAEQAQLNAERNENLPGWLQSTSTSSSSSSSSIPLHDDHSHTDEEMAGTNYTYGASNPDGTVSTTGGSNPVCGDNGGFTCPSGWSEKSNYENIICADGTCSQTWCCTRDSITVIEELEKLVNDAGIAYTSAQNAFEGTTEPGMENWKEVKGLNIAKNDEFQPVLRFFSSNYTVIEDAEANLSNIDSAAQKLINDGPEEDEYTTEEKAMRDYYEKVIDAYWKSSLLLPPINSNGTVTLSDGTSVETPTGATKPTAMTTVSVTNMLNEINTTELYKIYNNINSSDSSDITSTEEKCNTAYGITCYDLAKRMMEKPDKLLWYGSDDSEQWYPYFEESPIIPTRNTTCDNSPIYSGAGYWKPITDDGGEMEIVWNCS